MRACRRENFQLKDNGGRHVALSQATYHVLDQAGLVSRHNANQENGGEARSGVVRLSGALADRNSDQNTNRKRQFFLGADLLYTEWCW